MAAVKWSLNPAISDAVRRRGHRSARHLSLVDYFVRALLAASPMHDSGGCLYNR